MIRLLVIISALVFCASCVIDSEAPRGERAITFTLAGSPADAGTKAAGDAEFNENNIDRLDIFFFDRAGECVYYPTDYNIEPDNRKVTITISESAANTLFGQNLRLYLIANAAAPRSGFEGRTLEEVQSMLHINPAELNPEPFVKQHSFVMDGIKDINIGSYEDTNLGSITLRRAAAKIELRITGAGVQGYTAVSATARLNNYVEKTVIGSDAPQYRATGDEFRHSLYRPVWVPGTGVPAFETNPFYCYANEWEKDPSTETYLTIAVLWSRDGDGHQRNYYYRIPFNFIPPSSQGESNCRVKRNRIYTFSVDISALGGLDPEDMLDLSPRLELKDWTTEDIEVSLNQYEYLVVSQTNIEIHDVTTKEIGYASSKPVGIVDVTAYYFEYKYIGDIVRVDYTAAQHPAKFPVFVIDTDRNAITITSPVPVNYVPVYIEFTVRNEAGLRQKVSLVQYPRQYVTSEYSSGPASASPGGIRYDPEQVNYNFYTVTTTSLVPGDPFSIGGDMMAWQADKTYPQGGYWVTKMDEAANNTISPKFVIASQRGIASVETSHLQSQERCYSYRESQYPSGSWRIPTMAEMALVAHLQADPQSAVKGLFTPKNGYNRWWTARRNNVQGGWQAWSIVVDGSADNGDFVLHYFISGVSETGSSSPTGNSVRCVHDVWKD